MPCFHFQRLGLAMALCLLLISILSASDYASVQDLIEKGNLPLARQRLAELRSASSDWRVTYLEGILKADGEVSIASMERSLDLCDADCGELISTLASAYYSLGQYEKVVALYERIRALSENDKTTFRALWFVSLAYFHLEELNKAEGVIKKIAISTGETRGWGELLNANQLHLRNKKPETLKGLTGVISAGGIPALIALYTRTYYYAEAGDMDRALTGLNMLKNDYGDFLGSKELLSFLDRNDNVTSSGAAERIAGVRYTIQLGTFANRAEITALEKRLRKEGWTCFEKTTDVDGRKYWILTVGSFSTIESAQKSKKSLEKKLTGTFRVVMLE